MKIPRIFYGKAGQATARVRKQAKALLRTRDYATYDPGPLLSTEEVGGVILISKELMASTDEHFHCYALSEGLAEASAPSEVRKNLHDWLVASLGEEWRFMCTLGGLSWIGLEEGGPLVARRYVEAAVQHWPSMSHERARFGPVPEGGDILDRWYTLFAALEMLGLPSYERVTLPTRDPQALLDVVAKRGG
jgi:hypothetical protein